ncbi:MAG TPA: hypothetical protein VGE06_05595 [Flavisolibacter sp.]
MAGCKKAHHRAVGNEEPYACSLVAEGLQSADPKQYDDQAFPGKMNPCMLQYGCIVKKLRRDKSLTGFT